MVTPKESSQMMGKARDYAVARFGWQSRLLYGRIP
jgi:hypothetical protein